MTYIGIDVGKTVLEVAALTATGEVSRRQFGNTAKDHQSLIRWLAQWQDCHIILEATSTYHQRLLQALQERQLTVTVINPTQSSFFARSLYRRNKTDKVDALMLALYGKERQPAVSRAQAEQPRAIAREIEAINKDLTRLKNRLEASEQGLSHPEVTSSLRRRIQNLEEEKEALKEQLERLMQQERGQELALLQTIPGIGGATACLLLAELGDIQRFSSAAALVAYAGLTPCLHQSGSLDKRTRISRMGSAHLRYILYFPAVSGLRWNSRLKEFFLRLVSRGKAKKAALTACMAKLLRIVYGVLASKRPFVAQASSP